MPINWVDVHGYDSLEQVTPTLSGRTILYFIGDRDANQKSWCPDCVASDALVEKIKPEVGNITAQVNFVTVSVGDRASWKDPASKFRTNHGISSIPTLVVVGTEKSISDDKVTEDAIRNLFV